MILDGRKRGTDDRTLERRVAPPTPGEPAGTLSDDFGPARGSEAERRSKGGLKNGFRTTRPPRDFYRSSSLAGDRGVDCADAGRWGGGWEAVEPLVSELLDSGEVGVRG